jgi:Fe-S-cluster containining protein
MAESKSITKWYIGGLAFECVQCGRCCSGPGEGYIWITRPEIELIAEFLNISIGELRRGYLKRVGVRMTIIEHSKTRDCIFLQQSSSRRGCSIYPVRPSQCRSWPFWSENLASISSWTKTGQKCPGINRGKKYSFEQIEEIRKNKKWWMDKNKLSK